MRIHPTSSYVVRSRSSVVRSRSSELPRDVRAALTELGLIEPGASADEQREALRVFQHARNLPETGLPDRATRAELRGGLTTE